MKKILGQSKPAATTLTDLYEVASGLETVTSTLMVCNRAAAVALFRVSCAPGGDADSDEQYIYYDVEIPANDTMAATIGITLSAGDVMRVWSDSGNVAFSLFGIEA